MHWLKAAKIYLEDGVLENGAIKIENDKIAVLCSANEIPSDAKNIKEYQEIMPGMIDMHMHGAGGADIMDGTVEAIDVMARTLFQEGIAGFVPAIMTESPAKIETAISAAKEFSQKKHKDSAEILGIHLEGPFLAKARCGAQDPKKIIAGNLELLKKWHEQCDGLLKMVTMAPEVDTNFYMAKYLKEQNIIASVGHTEASCDLVFEALKNGYSHATHLFNAMSGINHHNPGAVTALLLDESATLELVVDGFHLHPAIVKLVYEFAGPDRIILVTDSMRARGMGDGEYELGGQKVFVNQGAARLKDGTLAGSTLTMDRAVKNMLKFTGCSMREIVKMVVVNPAKKLNVFNEMGSITKGKKAAFVTKNHEI